MSIKQWFRAFEVLGFGSDDITLQKLETVLPNQFGGKFKDNKINARLMIEALYRSSIHEQQEDIDRVEQDEMLLVPTDIDYKK